MESFIARRLADRRFNDRPIDMHSRPVSWYEQPSRLTVKRSNAAMKSDSNEPSSPKKKKEKKKKTEGEGGATSDATDNDRCWSDYKPDGEPYAKGSCVPESESKKKDKK